MPESSTPPTTCSICWSTSWMRSLQTWQSWWPIAGPNNAGWPPSFHRRVQRQLAAVDHIVDGADQRGHPARSRRVRGTGARPCADRAARDHRRPATRRDSCRGGHRRRVHRGILLRRGRGDRTRRPDVTRRRGGPRVRVPMCGGRPGTPPVFFRQGRSIEVDGSTGEIRVLELAAEDSSSLRAGDHSH